jgi:urease accessory protein
MAAMLVIDSIPETVAPKDLEGKETDKVVLTWEQRRWTRGRLRTAGGREIAIALKTGSVLEPGSILCVEPGWYVTVEAAEEPTLVISPPNQSMAIRVAFEVGNRHFPLAIAGSNLLVPDDTAMVQLLSHLGVPWERHNAIFAPIGGGHHHEH